MKNPWPEIPESDEGLVRPMKRRGDPDLGPDAMLAIISNDLDYLAKLTQGRKRDVFDLDHFRVYQLRDKKEECFSIVGPFLGAPHAVMGMEKIIALGAKRIWVLGWCGSLQPDVRIGELVIPAESISEEGTSQHYPIGKTVPTTDQSLNNMLEAVLRKKGKSFVKGTVWTTDAPYRETPAKIITYQKKGVLAVDMEMSALMTLGIYRSVKVAGLLVVSDELFDLKWHTGFKNPAFKEACRSRARLLLNLVESLGKEDNGRHQGSTGY
jgi:uridine phosphorylase